ncbi:hypothetical protein FOZ62_014681, partial [Perkinsus olseni]
MSHPPPPGVVIEGSSTRPSFISSLELLDVLHQARPGKLSVRRARTSDCGFAATLLSGSSCLPMAPPKKAEQTPAVVGDDNERVDDDKESRITDHEGDEEEDDDREQESLEEEGSKGKSRLEKEFESLCDDEASGKEDDPARADSPRSSAATASP